MITAKIKDNHYQICHEWSDLTIERAARLHAIKMPESLYNCYEVAITSASMPKEKAEKRIATAETQITIEDQHKNFPRYFGEVLCCLSDVPPDMISKIDVLSIKAVYHTYLKQFVEGVHFIPSNYRPNEITGFEFMGERFELPSDTEIFGERVPMVNVTALEFAESAHYMITITTLQQAKDFAQIANLIAILCRPEGELYNEETVLKRAREFRGLPMTTTWDVFFSLIVPLIIYGQSAQTSSLIRDLRPVKSQMN